MDSPPKKRRRTSPRLSERNSQADANTTTTPPDPPPASDLARSNRPSFASPTRASLARHNPQILERRQSMPRSQGHAQDQSASGASRRIDRDPHSEAVGELASFLGEQLAQSVEGPDRDVRQASVGAEARRPLQQPPSRSPSRSPTRKMGSMFSEPPRRTPVKPIPRPLPPADPARSEDILQPLLAQEKRRSGLELFRTAEAVEPEPELPPTPEHVDVETTPPSGIHNSTPTKRKSKKPRGKKQQSSSPLKQAPLRLPVLSKRERVETKETAGETRVLRRGRSSHAARGIEPVDPDADKKKEKQQILDEIAQLETDIALAAAENEKIRKGALDRGELPEPLDSRAVFELLRRTALPAEEEKPSQSEAWLQAAANPISFLPFGKPGGDLSELLLFGSSMDDEEEKPPVSHHPIPMTKDEELPYLQVFSPLAFTSQIVVLPQETPDAPLLQKHFITAKSTTPRGLFIAHIEMTVNSKSLLIVELAVPRIDPSAEPELRPFVDRIGAGDQMETGSALVRNVTVLAWAMGEWVRVAVRRAKFWALLQRRLGTKDALQESIQKFRAQSSRSHRRKRRRGHHEESDGDEDGEDELLSGGNSSSTKHDAVTAAELLPYMGQSATDIDLPLPDDAGTKSKDASSCVRVQWDIAFDWTGEAQSRIGILVGLPGKWRKADDRGRLARLPKLFDQMVQGSQKPARAVQTVVALLAGEEGV